MLTVNFDRLSIAPGDLILDIGCGAGRHSFEAMKRGADVVAVDLDREKLPAVGAMLAALRESGEARPDGLGAILQGDITRLPFAKDTFDHVIASEILEHIPQDRLAMSELARVVKPGGTVIATVPRFWPEGICWALSRTYTSNAGGHVRIYRSTQLVDRLEEVGLSFIDAHHAHAFHAPYWWVKCAVGVDNDEAFLPRTYKRFLEWQIVTGPPLVNTLERVLDPILGKSFAVYARKPSHESEAIGVD